MKNEAAFWLVLLCILVGLSGFVQMLPFRALWPRLRAAFTACRCAIGWHPWGKWQWWAILDDRCRVTVTPEEARERKWSQYHEFARTCRACAATQTKWSYE